MLVSTPDLFSASGAVILLLTSLVIPLFWLLGRTIPFLLRRLFKVGKRKARADDVLEGCKQRLPQQKKRCVAVLGSGGHSSELLQLIEGWDMYDFVFIAADSDPYCHKILERNGFKIDERTGSRSAAPAHHVENQKGSRTRESGSTGSATGARKCSLFLIQRSRHVGEGWVSSLVHTLQACAQCVNLVRRERLIRDADLLLVNGPGVCVPVVFGMLLSELLGWRGTTFASHARLVFVESFARVRSISMTGRILQPWVDRFVVQWRATESPTKGKHNFCAKFGLTQREYAGTLL
ncbi:unnamed protein product [Amoebophrya sp. A25]|nr:unnamed protein product [Amoebophrya sp. A25]|eukprot:GSA25T00000236001.1